MCPARYLAGHAHGGQTPFRSLVTFAASRAVLAAEILALHHQLAVLERSSPARLPLTCGDRALWAFALDWYNQDRVHLALGKDAPDHRPQERPEPELANVVSLPHLGGLHHRYCRRAA